MKLQLCSTEYRHHYVKTKVVVREYQDTLIDVFHGPRRIASFNQKGEPLKIEDTMEIQKVA
jgi:hypothetical protein